MVVHKHKTSDMMDIHGAVYELLLSVDVNMIWINTVKENFTLFFLVQMHHLHQSGCACNKSAIQQNLPVLTQVVLVAINGCVYMIDWCWSTVVVELCIVYYIWTNDHVFTEHVPPYPAQKMNESIKEYLRCLWRVVVGVLLSICVFYWHYWWSSYSWWLLVHFTVAFVTAFNSHCQIAVSLSAEWSPCRRQEM